MFVFGWCCLSVGVCPCISVVGVMCSVCVACDYLSVVVALVLFVFVNSCLSGVDWL